MSKFTDLLNNIQTGNIVNKNQEAMTFADTDERILSTDRFRYPDMGDFYLNSVDDPYHKRVAEALAGIKTESGLPIFGNTEESSEHKTAAINFFVEDQLPYGKDDLGEKKSDGVFWIKARVDYENQQDRIDMIELGSLDGDTIPFSIDSIDAGSEEEKALLIDTYIKKMSEMGFADDHMKQMEVRILGLNAPEVAHWFVEDNLKKEDLDKRIKTVRYGDIKGDRSNYVVMRNEGRNEGQLITVFNSEENNFEKIGPLKEKWHEYRDRKPTKEQEREGLVPIEYLSKMEEEDPVRIEDGKRAAILVRDLIDAAGGEVYFLLDRVSLNQNNLKYPSRFGDVHALSPSLLDKAKYAYSQYRADSYNRFKYTGFNQWGRDLYGRYLGAAYVSINGHFINIGKYVITQSKETEVLPDYTSMPGREATGGSASRKFNLNSYVYEDRVLFDIHATVTKELDDRRRVQEAIFKMNFDQMKAWNVTIGDTTLFVPPTSIRVSQQTTHERLPILRGKGSMTKGTPKIQKMIELTVYFNEERGINGYPFSDKLPNGDNTVYYMNGLRALIAQFKFVPFLPIENDYVNRILNIEAVTLVGMQIITNPSMPRLITCVLTMQEFDYTQYMPEIPLDVNNEDAYYNPFSSVFNFALMRWYYQKPLILGEKMRDISINDSEYVNLTDGSRTALMPMDFKDPYFRVYVANESHLEKMHQTKIQKVNNPSRSYSVITEDDEQFIRDLHPIFDAYKELNGHEEIEKVLASLKALPNKAKEEYLFASNLARKNFGKKISEQSMLGIRKHGDYSVRKTEEVTAIINQLISLTNIKMYEANVSRTLLNQSSSFIRENKDGIYIGIVYTINSAFLTEETLRVLIEAAEKIVEPNKGLGADITSGKIVVEYKIELDADIQVVNDVTVRGASEEAEITLHNGTHMQYVAAIGALYEDIQKGKNEMNSEFKDMKEDIDFNLLETLIYDEVLLGEVRIKNLACSYGNNFTQIGLNGTEGYAAQYMGGQDTVIELGIETTDEFSVGILNGLPKLASHILKTYRIIMPSSPIKFESEITRMLGVCEVVIESIEVSTVPNVPGLYEINLRLVSMDRTSRHREGLRKVNEQANGGMVTQGGRQNIRLRTFDHLHDRFGKAELYPDLELPTIDELKGTGFHFLRHTFDKSRVYPDPDFYFNYGHILQSEIYRESILNVEDSVYDITYTNKDGEYVVNAASKTSGSVDIEKSEGIENAELAVDEVHKQSGYASSKKIDRYIENEIPVLNTLNTSSSDDVWDIGQDVRVMLMEKPYREMIRMYEEHATQGKTEERLKWLYDSLNSVREARKMIDEYLLKPIEKDNTFFLFKEGKSHYKAAAENALLSTKAIFETLGIKDVDKAKDKYGEMVYAAACSKTGKKEYRKGLDKEEYSPRLNFMGFRVNTSEEGVTYNAGEAGENNVHAAVEFGPFATRMRTEKEVRELLDTKGRKNDIARFTVNPENINTQLFLIDPYYATKATLEEIEKHKKDIASDVSYACYAFHRECLVWLAKLIDDNLLPNINFDIFNGEFEQELKKQEKEVTKKSKAAYELDDEEEDIIKEQLSQYLEFLEDIERPMDNGKLFLLTTLNVCGMDLYKFVAEGNFKELNHLKISLTSTSSQFEEHAPDHMALKRFFSALIPAGVVEGIDDFSYRKDDVMQKNRRVSLDRKYIEFAEDPDIYTRHAFYDMCVNDMRGRMARAFPSFYIVLTDEGREIGLYKLNDNFYNINSVSEIQVHKSRRLPADTCRIVMSNLFHTFTQDDEDRVIEYEYGLDDAFNSLYNPREIYDKEQDKRLQQSPLNKVKLTPGTRIHVRMGYGANAATLPVVFNGKITEINAGDVMEVVCQGDGLELAQPILDNIDADEVDNADKLLGGIMNLFDNASTPKEILTELLTIKGEWWRKRLYGILPWIKNPSRYGYVSFGDLEYTEIFKNGEVVQNIYEAIGKSPWATLHEDVKSSWHVEGVPKFSIELMGKSFWDVLHICASASPDYIGAVANFGMRSTIFHGHPRHYYAYDYVKGDAGDYYEKRKPFQQYHIVTSFSDIIANNIKADATRLSTNAVGSFKAAGNTGFVGSRTNYTKRIFVDWDIYPENQRSIIYDTQMYDKGVPMTFFIGKGSQLLNRESDYGISDTGTHGVVQNGYPIANRMTSNALKESVKDMYTGDIVLMGIPSLKPHDRIYIQDTYEHMNGQVLVESVTHSLSVETGMTSTVVPDCISTVDDQFEKGTRGVMSYFIQASTIGWAAILAGSAGILKWRKKDHLLSSIGWAYKAIEKGSGGLLKKAGELVEGSDTKGARAVRASAEAGERVLKEIGESRIVNPVEIGKIGRFAKLGAFSHPATWAWLVIEFCLSAMVGQTSNRMVQEAMKHSQVLTVFPVFHNGRVLTAGMNGSVGAVYGSVNYNRLGTLDKVFSYLDNETNGFGWAMNQIVDVIANPETQKMAHKLATRAIEGTEQDEDVEREIDAMDMLKGFASRESTKISGFERLLISPRVQPSDEKAAAKYQKVMKLYGGISSEALEMQQRIVSENTYILNDTELERMSGEETGGFFKIFSDENYTTNHEMRTFYVNGTPLDIKVMKKTEENGESTYYDLPFLKDEAISVLKVILSECSRNISSFEQEKDKNLLNKDIVVLSSALIIGGSVKSMANTGYSFRLTAEGDNKDEFLKQALANVKQYVTEEYEGNRTSNPAVVEYMQIAVNTYQVTVYPPDLGV